MNATHRCPSCGSELPAGSPEQPCPACLLKLGMESWARRGEDAARTRIQESNFEPPTPRDLTERLEGLEVLELIGQGGMGAVYKARQVRLDRIVALKILKPAVSEDQRLSDRFLREAQALARLNHRHIVAVYDFGQQDDLCYLVMEYVDGVNLRQVLESGRLAPEEALRIVPVLCDALQFAHDAGIVHRDIKPENILLDQQGLAKITDFGLAKIVGTDGLSLTATRQVLGTLHYMAPEQYEGAQTIDHRADIYSLGVVLYEMLTGELPIGRFAPPSAKVEVDVKLDEIVLRTLEKDPNRRYQRVTEFRTDVESVGAMPAARRAAGGSVPPRPADSLPAGSGLPRFSRKAIVGAAWAGLCCLGLLSFVTVSDRVTTQRAPTDSGFTRESLTGSGMVIEGRQGDEDVRVEVSPFGGVLAAERRPRREPSFAERMAWWQWLLLVVSVIGLAAPIGTTVLGMVAIGDIRHAAGRVYGLPLAVADALLFPLLVLDAFIAWGLLMLFSAVYSAFHDQGIPDTFVGWVFLAAIPLWIVADVWIARAVWRSVNRPLAPAAATDAG